MATRSDVRAVVGEVGNLDESVILNVVETLKHLISSSMQTILDKLLKEIRSDRDQIHKLREHVLTKVLRPMGSRSVLGNEIAKTEIDNLVHLDSLISKHPELTLLIEHDVIFNENTKKNPLPFKFD